MTEMHLDVSSREFYSLGSCGLSIEIQLLNSWKMDSYNTWERFVIWLSISLIFYWHFISLNKKIFSLLLIFCPLYTPFYPWIKSTARKESYKSFSPYCGLQGVQDQYKRISDIGKKVSLLLIHFWLTHLLNGWIQTEKNMFSLTNIFRRVLPHLPPQTLFIAQAYFVDLWSFSGFSKPI